MYKQTKKPHKSCKSVQFNNKIDYIAKTAHSQIYWPFYCGESKII